MAKQLSIFDTPVVTLDPQGTVILILQRTRFGIERKVSLDRVQLNADTNKSLLSLQAKIMDSPQMKQLISLDGEMSREINRLALPSIFRFGAHVVPIGLVKTLEAKLQDYKERRELLQDEVVRKAEWYLDKTMKELGPLADTIKWPTVNQIRYSFSVRWRFCTIGIPTDLRNLDPQIYEKEARKIQEDLEAQKQTIEYALLKGFQDQLAWIIERMSPDPSRKRKKVVKTSALRRFKQFLALMPDRNATGLSDLNELAQKAQAILEGVDPKDLATLPAESIRQQFEVMKDTIDRQIEVLPERTRAISFDLDLAGV